MCLPFSSHPTKHVSAHFFDVGGGNIWSRYRVYRYIYVCMVVFIYVIAKVHLIDSITYSMLLQFFLSLLLLSGLTTMTIATRLDLFVTPSCVKSEALDSFCNSYLYIYMISTTNNWKFLFCFFFLNFATYVPYLLHI